MKITVSYQGKAQELDAKGNSVLHVLEHLKINPEIVLVARNGTIVPETEELHEGDSLEIIRTVSGG